MPNEIHSEIQTKTDRDTPQDYPSPSLSPSIKGDKDGSRKNGHGSGSDIAKKENGIPHWTGYAEAFCAILLVLITGTYTYYSAKQTEATQDAASAAISAADVARQTLEAANRPWITAKAEIASPLQFNNAGASTTISFSLKNIGHSPAISPQFRADIVTLPEKTWQSAEIRQAIKDECNRVGDSFAGSPHLIPTLFPDDSSTLNFAAGINRDGMANALQQTQSGPSQHPGSVRLYVVACVDYRWSYASSPQQTGYGFQLGTPSAVGYMGDIQAQSTHPEVRLIFLDDVAQ